MGIETALIHRARLVKYQRLGVRTTQGAYPMVPVTGPWFDARVMLADVGGEPRRSTGAQGTGAGRVAVKYEVLADIVDENDVPLEVPTSGTLETDCPVLGNPTLVIIGQPEFVNDGWDPIGWLIMADAVEDVP